MSVYFLFKHTDVTGLVMFKKAKPRKAPIATHVKEVIKSKHSSLQTIMSHTWCVNLKPIWEFIFVLSKF